MRKMDSKGQQSPKKIRRMGQRLASLEQDARQPRLPMKTDVPADERPRQGTEDAAKAVRAMDGDSFSANRVQAGPRTTSTSFIVKAEPPALPCRDDVLVENSAAAPKLCLSPLEMRTSTAAGGLLPTGKTSSATRTTFDQPSLRLTSTEETKSERASTLSTSYDSRFWRSNLLAGPSCPRVIETKSGQNLMFDPCCSKGRLCACLFLGIWRALLCGEVLRLGTGRHPRERFLAG